MVVRLTGNVLAWYGRAFNSPPAEDAILELKKVCSGVTSAKDAREGDDAGFGHPLPGNYFLEGVGSVSGKIAKADQKERQDENSEGPPFPHKTPKEHQPYKLHPKKSDRKVSTVDKVAREDDDAAVYRKSEIRNSSIIPNRPIGKVGGPCLFGDGPGGSGGRLGPSHRDHPAVRPQYIMLQKTNVFFAIYRPCHLHLLIQRSPDGKIARGIFRARTLLNPLPRRGNSRTPAVSNRANLGRIDHRSSRSTRLSFRNTTTNPKHRNHANPTISD